MNFFPASTWDSSCHSEPKIPEQIQNCLEMMYPDPYNVTGTVGSATHFINSL
jgi:hypothetical protein